MGCSPTTVQRYIAADGWVAFRSASRPGVLAGQGCLAERFRQHRGNADVVRQELAAEHGIAVSLRTVERAVASLRRELEAEALATVRFETPPGRQLQIDFGEHKVRIGEESVRALFVATLGYSRRLRTLFHCRTWKNANGRSSLKANHIGECVPSGSASFSENDVSGTRQRCSGPSYCRQCGLLTLRMFVTPKSVLLPLSANCGDGIRHRAKASSRPSGPFRTIAAW